MKEETELFLVVKNGDIMAKVLVVDDSETARVQVKMDLLNAGHEVLEAENGINGLEVLNANTDIQLIISDVNMPEMDGLSMCEEIAGNSKLNKIPIIMLTTQCGDDMKARGKKSGVVAWINKPHKAGTLVSGIEKILSRKVMP